MALFIPADITQPVRTVIPENGRTFSLDELYILLSCDLIDTRYLTDGRILAFDDDGKYPGCVRNKRATALADFAPLKQLIAEVLRQREEGVDLFWASEPLTDHLVDVDFIAGDALICHPHEWLSSESA